MRGSYNRLAGLLNSSVPMGRWLMGIPVEWHWSMFLLPVLVYAILAPGSTLPIWKLALGAVLIPFLIFFFVYLHECGHAFAFRLYDHPVKKIWLSPVGGICWGAQLRSPREELVVTFFGPLVNLIFVVILLGALFLWQWGLGQQFRLVWFTCRFVSFQAVGMELLTFMLAVNFLGAAFNLLVPMFPMDSGRILRATLASWYSPVKATEIVVRVGQVLGFVVITGGLVLMIYGYVFDGLELAVIAMMMMMYGYRELERTRIQPVYSGAGAFDAVNWQPSNEDYEAWQRRAEKQQEKDAKQAEETRQKVDQLLEKISHDGIGALSEKERDFLTGASKSFRNRVS